ncbi:acetate kinase [Arenibacter nanhaiticus]|uniref:Acetate kinase n=1 Tax=Arenibacter nanhaiticus TaxID=558155 RepID=A0A1M6JB71_9FLAO|nr:acetate kinase [Arenibacter nanhaiticus]SHJ43882.1 acetate kinase [Arenibacter nanhaiticus]
MKILILNSGSSSIKYQLIQMPAKKVLCKGMIDAIGNKNAVTSYKSDAVDIKEKQEIPNHKVGLLKIADLLLDKDKGVIKDSNEIAVVGHRVVHGGNSFSKTTLIEKAVKDKIKQLCALAPLHNPHNLEGIILAETIFTAAKQIAVFDTAFHQTIPVKAKKYAIPNEFYTEHGIQVYGFHGTSHKYVSEVANDYLENKKAKVITVHLGNGCSMTAVSEGKSIDHSLGFTPSNGLIMGTRCGDIDQTIIFHLVKTLGYSLEEVNTLLVKKSGMYGLTGYSDLREIEAEAENGNKACMLALEMNAYRIKKYIGAYTAAMNGLDALVFTAGIGENSATLRAMVCRDMDYMGLHLDAARNDAKKASIREINTPTAKVKILVIPTDEELEIAKQAHELLGQLV